MRLMSSKGEKKIERILSINGFSYKKEISFNNLRGFKQPLRFDFAVYRNNKFLFLLEVDGQQHFEYIPYFHKTKAGFRKEIIMDEKKNSFCLLNKIPLIRIPYWALEELTIRDILTNKDFILKSKHHYSYFNNGGGNK